MKKILIYGGSSLISIELIKIINEEVDKLIIFCRNEIEFKEKIRKLHLDENKFEIKETDLEKLDDNLVKMEALEDLKGIYWISGYNGDPSSEINNAENCKKNINVNFLHPVLLINKLITKLNTESDLPFIVVVASVAGLRGRAKNLFYGSAKSGLISYLSGLRQMYNNKINVITVIPGYISTKNFNISAPSFLISKPETLAKKMVKAVNTKKEIIYSNIWWKLIMVIINVIPEKIFKKLKF